MPTRFILLACLLLRWSSSYASEHLKPFLESLGRLEFEQARRHITQESDSALRREMFQLAELLYYEGQKDRSSFPLHTDSLAEPHSALSLIRKLNAGYLSLYYDQVKGNAYRNFYKAYQLSRTLDEPVLIKTCLTALLKYYNLEIAQNSDTYEPYLKQLDDLQDNEYDRLWITIYRMIFYSKDLKGQDDRYFRLLPKLDSCSRNIYPKSPVWTCIYYEKAVLADIAQDTATAKTYYLKTLAQSTPAPYLKSYRFFSSLKLMLIEAQNGYFARAHRHLVNARLEANRTDTLRANYHLNLYEAHFLNTQHKYDSAFTLLMKAYTEDFMLDFRRNTLEINRLNVELDTREKENANLRLSKSRNWLISALIGVSLLALASYFAYSNQRSRSHVQLKEKEIQTMKLEKLLKDQEMTGIDAMIEGQEKERQRLANDLHDNLGSQLATVKHHFQHLKNRQRIEDIGLYQKTEELIEETYQKVRSIAHTRNLGMNPQEGLLPAVRRFAGKVSILNKLVINVEEHGMDKRLDSSLEIAIFRIIQELITNVIKHAHATEAIIHLTQHEDAINLMVEDNGTGFDQSLIKPGETMGLYSIQKRIENVGGQVTIESIAQKGTTVIIDIPLT